MESLAAAECRVPRRALGGAATKEPMEGAFERAVPECRIPCRALGGAGGAAVPARIPSRPSVFRCQRFGPAGFVRWKGIGKRQVLCRGWVEDGQAEGWEQQVRCCS